MKFRAIVTVVNVTRRARSARIQGVVAQSASQGGLRFRPRSSTLGEPEVLVTGKRI